MRTENIEDFLAALPQNHPPAREMMEGAEKYLAPLGDEFLLFPESLS